MIEARAPIEDKERQPCSGCGGTKAAPIAAILSIHHGSSGVTVVLCEECGRDLANAVGFMCVCVRDGGWSKIEPRKRRPAR